jgi:hypothetical protein
MALTMSVARCPRLESRFASTPWPFRPRCCRDHRFGRSGQSILVMIGARFASKDRDDGRGVDDHRSSLTNRARHGMGDALAG